MPHLEFSALTQIFAQICVILLMSRVMAAIMRPLGQPGVIAEIIAGIALGPSLLGWLFPEAAAALFPLDSLVTLRLLSQVGLVIFMFLIGLELDPELFRGRAHTVVFISHASILFPFALGAGAAWWLHADYLPPGVPITSFMLFLGVAMSITAFPVLARILSELGLLTTRVGRMAMACAAIDDVTAWCLLAFVVAIARARGLADGIWTTLLAVAFVLFMLYGTRPLLRRWARSVDGKEALTPAVMATLFLLLIASSAVTEVIGIHALFGAFIFGVIAPRHPAIGKPLVEKLETITVVLLLPLFFAYSGLRTQIGLLDSREEWLTAAALILIATLGKFGGSAVAARASGMHWREASALGVLMNTRGLVELIVLNTGMDLGIISPAIFTMLVLMALATTMAASPVLRLVYPDARRDEVPNAGGQAPISRGEAPLGARAP